MMHNQPLHHTANDHRGVCFHADRPTTLNSSANDPVSLLNMGSTKGSLPLSIFRHTAPDAHPDRGAQVSATQQKTFRQFGQKVIKLLCDCMWLQSARCYEASRLAASSGVSVIWNSVSNPEIWKISRTRGDSPASATLPLSLFAWR